MNRKYTEEMREQTVVYYLESGKSQQVIANEIGIGINTLTRWVNRYKEEHGIPERTRKQLSSEELLNKIKQLEHENKEKARQIALRENSWLMSG